MGTGYTRNDTADNIADGNIINASDLDGEFDALQSAFDNSSGHTHDGTAGEGAPIEKVGPNQEVVVTATVLRPAANNTIDLGVQTTNEFKNLYIDGTAYLDSVDIDGGTIDGLSILTVDNLSLNGNTITSTDTDGNLNLRANGDGIIIIDSTDLKFGDTDKAMFGNGTDLQIYHDGSNSYIDEAGTGTLRIRGYNQVRITDLSDNVAAIFKGDAEATLYHNNSAKFATTDTGISVTGDVDASDDLILSSDGSKITFGADGDVELEHIHNFGLTLKTTGTGDNAFPEFVLQSNEDTIIADEVIGRIDFDTNSTAGGVSVGVQARITVDSTDTYSSTVAGSRMEFYTTKSNGALTKALQIEPDQSIIFTGGANVTLDATNNTLDFPDNFKIMVGSGDDLQIYHDGTRNYIDSNTTELRLKTSELRMVNSANTEIGLKAVEDGAVTLYYDANPKLATASTGVDITGAFTATDGSTITVGDNSVALNLVSTDTDASQGPILRLTRDATGAASDVIGTIHYYGEDAGGNGTQYAEIEGRIGDATDGAEDGELVLSTMISGTSRARLNFNSTESVFNEGSHDLDFRVESDTDPNAFFVQGSDGFTGIGTGAPAAHLHVNSGGINLAGLFESTDLGTIVTIIDHSTTGGSAAEQGLQTVGDQLEIRAVDNLSFETATVEAMRIASTGNVGIGHGTPDGLLHLKKTDSTAYSATATDGQVGVGPTIYLENPANSNGTVGGQIVFGMRSTEEQARIGATGGTSPALTFGTGDAEAMRISGGNLLVGKTSSDIGDTGLEADSNGHTKITRSSGTGNVNTVLQLNRLTTNGDILTLKKDSTEVGSIGSSYGDRINIGTGNTGIMFRTTSRSIDPADPSTGLIADNISLGRSGIAFKDLFLSGGVYLGGTGSANYLDDYEFGFFAPTYTSSGTNPSGVTYDPTVGNEGRYTKIGGVVHIQINIRTDAISNKGTGNVHISGLPFASGGYSSQGGYSVFTCQGDGFLSNQPSAAQIGENSTTLGILYRTVINGGLFSLPTSSLNTGSNDNLLRISGTYMTEE